MLRASRTATSSTPAMYVAFLRCTLSKLTPRVRWIVAPLLLCWVSLLIGLVTLRADRMLRRSGMFGLARRRRDAAFLAFHVIFFSCRRGCRRQSNRAAAIEFPHAAPAWWCFLLLDRMHSRAHARHSAARSLLPRTARRPRRRHRLYRCQARVAWQPEHRHRGVLSASSLHVSSDVGEVVAHVDCLCCCVVGGFAARRCGSLIGVIEGARAHESF